MIALCTLSRPVPVLGVGRRRRNVRESWEQNFNIFLERNLFFKIEKDCSRNVIPNNSSRFATATEMRATAQNYTASDHQVREEQDSQEACSCNRCLLNVWRVVCTGGKTFTEFLGGSYGVVYYLLLLSWCLVHREPARPCLLVID